MPRALQFVVQVVFQAIRTAVANLKYSTVQYSIKKNMILNKKSPQTGWQVKHSRVFLVPCKKWLYQCVHVYSSILDKYILQGIRKTRPCLTGHPVYNICLPFYMICSTVCHPVSAVHSFHSVSPYTMGFDQIRTVLEEDVLLDIVNIASRDENHT